MLIEPHRQIKKFKLFPFTWDMDKGNLDMMGFLIGLLHMDGVAFVPTKEILLEDDLKRKNKTTIL